MAAVQYPFIDIAVHERVRERFASGEAMVLFSADVDRVLWANGAGSALFGNASIYDFLEEGPAREDVTFRQLEASALQLHSVSDRRTLTIRVGSGFRRVPVQATVEMIVAPAGEQAVLFSAPPSGSVLGRAERARLMLEGFDDPDIHMAVLDEQGGIVAASPRFASLELAPRTARMLVDGVARESDRLIKRPIPTGKGFLPAAIGRLTDAPALHLLFAVETIIGNLDPVASFEAEAPVEEASPVETQEPAVPLPPATFLPTPELEAIAEIEELDDIDDFTEEVLADQADEILDRADELAADAEAAAETAAHASDEEMQQAKPAVDVASIIRHAGNFAFQPTGRAIRFVWKIDADGRFREVSDEFADAVGPHSADVNGRAFSELAALYDLDPQGKIADALGKRDTWSGRTIYWPVEGTTLKVPVDLAALPTYTRDREFDGFRGFGIVRIADAVEDPTQAGLALAAGPEAEAPALAAEPDADVSIADLGEQPAAVPDADGEQESDEAIAAGVDEENIVSADLLTTVTPGSLLDLIEEIEEEGSAEAEPERLAAPASPEPEVALAENEANKAIPDETAPKDERPPLRLVEQAQPSDKIVPLPGRRMPSRDSLTPVEQAAFREIARRLETFGKRTEPPAAEQPAPKVTEPERPTSSAAVTPSTPARSDNATEMLHETVQSLIPTRPRNSLSPDIIDQMPVALLVHSGDMLIHGNPEFLRLTGYASLEELQQLGGLDALLQREELADKAESSGGMMVVRADDAVIPVTARLQSIRWEEQGSALMLALMPVEVGMPETEAEDTPANVTEQISDDRLEELASLQVEVEELRSILETATDGVVIIGDDGEIRALNRSASALFNYDAEETRGKPFVMLFAHESQRAVADYLNGLAGHGVASVLNDGREVIGRESSGGFIPLFMTMGRLTSSAGYCAVIRDITQWKRTEEELRNAKRAAETANAHKSDFLARVSHEIRTPLNAIIGFSDMMATERFGPIGHPRYIEYANDIGRSGRHVLDIVNDLLDISKIEAGEMDLDFAAVSLNDAISVAVALVQPQANSQRVIIRTALSQAVPQVVADMRSLKQIALNVLANAIRFTPSGGQIVVSTAYEPNGSVVLRIRDTGIGMTRDELEQAMKPFRQVTTGSRKRDDGTGLGLPLTKAMVDANRANFAITSSPNEGTLVEITFPSPRVLAN